ncbi:MAG: HEPN domain-containing protein [Phycisphaerae bacterium]
MANTPDVAAWVEKAEEDAQVASALAALNLQAYRSSIAFHCQQSAEKYLKACLINAGSVFPKTHDFETLLGLCAGIEPGFESLADAARGLQPYAVEVRYPYATPKESETREALVHVETIRSFCRRLLGLA